MAMSSSTLPSHLKHLECCVCLEIRKGALHFCPNDHLICRECYAGLKKKNCCPICRADFGDAPRRNRLIEQMVEDLNLDDECPNADAGCIFKGKGERFVEHAKVCEYREVPCPSRDCSSRRVVLHRLSEHLVGPEHKAGKLWNVYDNVSFALWYSMTNPHRDSWKSIVWQVGEDKFTERLIKKGQVYYIWMHNHGAESQAENYRLTIRLAKENCSTTVLSTIGVHAIDATEEDILAGGLENVFTFDEFTARKLTFKEGNKDKLDIEFKFIKRGGDLVPTAPSADIMP